MRIKDEEYKFIIDGQVFHCALDITANFIGGKWKTVVLWYLSKATMRFNELRERIPQITDKMLSLQLKSLESDGFVSRTIYPEVPPRVEYALTEEGKTLIPLLNAMAEWGREKARKDGKMVKVSK